MNLAEHFQEGNIITLVFILVAIDLYANGVSASESFWIWSLAAIWTIPITLLKMLAVANPLLGPAAALAGLFIIMAIKESFGAGVWLAILAGSMVMALGV